MGYGLGGYCLCYEMFCVHYFVQLFATGNYIVLFDTIFHENSDKK